MQGKIVWITGATSGIGEALVREAVKRNATVIASARTRSKLESLQKELGVHIYPLDLENYTSLAGIAAQVEKDIGPVDVLINNGGISQRSFAKDTEISVYKKIIDVNYLGNIALTLAVLPSMIKRKTGYIATTSSVTGLFGSPLRSGYSASKHALHGFYDSLRAEISNEVDIGVSIICPGYVRTDVSINAVTADGSKHGKMDESTAKGLDPEYVAKLVIDKILKKKRVIVVAGFKERFAVFLSRFFPGLLARILKKAKVT